MELSVPENLTTYQQPILPDSKSLFQNKSVLFTDINILVFAFSFFSR